jgi:hypothetical protein
MYTYRNNIYPIRGNETLINGEEKHLKSGSGIKIWNFLKIKKEHYEVYKKDGYKAYVSMIEKNNFIEKISNLDFHYCCDLSYEENYPCKNGSDCCDNDYCRCGTINGAKVARVPFCSDFCHTIYDLIDPSIINLYFINRIYSVRNLYKPDSYSVSVTSGYYGQEIDSVKIDDREVIKDLIFMFENSNNLQKLQEYLLILEYGHIHPRFKNKKFEIEKISLDKISIGNDHHYNKIVEPYEIDLNNVLGVLIEEGDKLSLMDGYHRIKFAKTSGLQGGLFVIAK